MMQGASRKVYWKRIGEVMEASHCLSSLHICLDKEPLPHEVPNMLASVCRKEGLTDLTVDKMYDGRGKYVLSL